MKSTVLITGGSGLIGKHLTSMLLSAGHQVVHLSRGPSSSGRVRVVRWDPLRAILDPSAIDGIDTVIHLAGANIGEKRWTRARREEIVASRTSGARLLRSVIASNRLGVKTFISASAAGYYGAVTTDHIFTEDDPPAGDFLGTTCRLWEEEAARFADEGIRTVILRSGVVLDRNDSALKKMSLPAKFGFLVMTGTGRQYMPWIHIADICGIYLRVAEDASINGTYNAVAPEHITHREFMQLLARVLRLPLLPLNVPSPALKLVFGTMSDVILKGSRLSSEKIQLSGYNFKFPGTEAALRDIYG